MLDYNTNMDYGEEVEEVSVTQRIVDRITYEPIGTIRTKTPKFQEFMRIFEGKRHQVIHIVQGIAEEKRFSLRVKEATSKSYRILRFLCAEGK